MKAWRLTQIQVLVPPSIDFLVSIVQKSLKVYLSLLVFHSFRFKSLANDVIGLIRLGASVGALTVAMAALYQWYLND
jgi:hypothetical protein